MNVDVGWDTGDATVKGRVFRSLNGGAEAPLQGASLSSGTAAVKISLNERLTFVLRRASNGQELARETVTTQKDALATYMTDPDLGFIFSLKVNPGVDTIGVAFQTTRPAVPYVEIRRRESGELVDFWMGQNFQQQHQHEFSGGLPQDNTYDVRIVALKDIGGGRVSLGSGAHNPEVRGEVITGARTVSFLFDLIHVRNDGDPAGPGEFTFGFGVGDVATQQQLGPVEWWGEDEIPAGHDRDVVKVITIEHAPRKMWAQVVAWEDDTSIFNPNTLGFGRPGMRPSYSPPGSDGFETDYGSLAWVSRDFDTNSNASGRQAGFIMSTGDFSIAYDVYGAMTVTRRNGINNFKGVGLGRYKPHKRRAKRHGAVIPAGQTRTFNSAGHLTAVSLGPDGAVIVRTIDLRTGVGFVTDLGGRFDTSVTLVESPHDTLHVLSLSPTGEVVTRSVTPNYADDDAWIPLGGEFIGAVTGVARDRLADVLARDAEGKIFHRVLPADGECGDWMRIGGGGKGPVVASGTPTGSLAVFELDLDGRILHKRLNTSGEWMPEAGEWEVVCNLADLKLAERTISVHWDTDEDLIVSVFVGDELEGALLWRCYPKPDPSVEWVPVVEAL